MRDNARQVSKRMLSPKAESASADRLISHCTLVELGGWKYKERVPAYPADKTSTHQGGGQNRPPPITCQGADTGKSRLRLQHSHWNRLRVEKLPILINAWPGNSVDRWNDPPQHRYSFLFPISWMHQYLYAFDPTAQHIDMSDTHAFIVLGLSDLRGPCPALKVANISLHLSK